MKKFSSHGFVKSLGIAILIAVITEIFPYWSYVFLACLLILFIRALLRKEITAKKLMNDLSVLIVCLSIYFTVFAFLNCLQGFSLRALMLLINDIVFLVFGVYSLRNYDVSGKEHRLPIMSAFAFMSSVITTLLFYVLPITGFHAETNLPPMESIDILYISLAVIAAVYFFAARRNLANKDYR